MKKNQKAEFSKADLGIPDNEIIESEIKDLKKQVDYVKESYLKKDAELNEIRQLIHQKGLEVGLPAQLLYDINRIATIITDIRKDMPDLQSQEYKDEEQEIVKCLNRGDEILAYHKRMLQSQRYERKLFEVKSYLGILIQILNLYQSRLQSQE